MKVWFDWISATRYIGPGYDPALLSKYFDVNSNALLSQHQKICNDMNIMIQLCSNKYRILKNIKSVWAASLEESKGFYFKGQVHNNFRLAAAVPWNGLEILATPNLALSENFTLYKDRLQFLLVAIEDNLCIVWSFH